MCLPTIALQTTATTIWDLQQDLEREKREALARDCTAFTTAVGSTIMNGTIHDDSEESEDIGKTKY